ncbi:MAG: hypothetical protein MZU84_00615 [Sphingobacterium sp.]|nr:hypothetical protein [Sphingobacterium sp.]
MVELREKYPFVDFFVQPSDIRCYTDEEYKYLKIPLREDLSNCDILMGVKEVDKRVFMTWTKHISSLHMLPRNRNTTVKCSTRYSTGIYALSIMNISTTDKGQRVVAFGRWAGIVGAYNALRARGIKTNRFKLKPAYQCRRPG